MSAIAFPDLTSSPQLDWRTLIHSDPEVLLGKPVVKGTRLAVDFILRLFANGWSREQVLENYPSLTAESLRAIFAYAADCMEEEALYAMPMAVGE